MFKKTVLVLIYLAFWRIWRCGTASLTGIAVRSLMVDRIPIWRVKKRCSSVLPYIHICTSGRVWFGLRWYGSETIIQPPRTRRKPHLFCNFVLTREFYNLIFGLHEHERDTGIQNCAGAYPGYLFWDHATARVPQMIMTSIIELKS